MNPRGEKCRGWPAIRCTGWPAAWRVRRRLVLRLWFPALLTLGSCISGSVETLVFGEEKAETTIAALPAPPPPDEALSGAGNAENDSQLVLESGNHWVAGIPGFDENALAAFSGDYRIPGKTIPVRIWLTREFLYYRDWAGRDVFGLRVRQKMVGEGRIIAAGLEGMWNMVLLLPPELNAEEEDRLITVLTGRFDGFSVQAENVSLPALIPY
jgi:hypothetical protein